MSRIADAFARAGKRLPGEDKQRWEIDHAAALKHLGEQSVKDQKTAVNSQLPTSNFQLPTIEEDPWFLPLQPATKPSSSVLGIGDAESRTRRNSASGDTIDFELTAALRRIFLAPKSVVRSVLFCTTPGGRMTDVAWRAAELLSAQSGQRVAFVEDPYNRVVSEHPGSDHGLITLIDWCDDENDAVPRADGITVDPAPKQTIEVLGEQISDLLPKFAFVIVNVTVPMNDLLSLSRQVDGVIVVIKEGETRRDAAKKLVIRLKDEARLLGAILIT